MSNNMAEMTIEEKSSKEPNESQTGENAAEILFSELAALCWSVVSFDKCEANHLTYKQAEEKLRELRAQKVSGLCIVTDDAAERIGG